MRHDFDELWIVDLGGEGRGALIEENVFDILTPVAIAFGVRTGAQPNPSKDPCKVLYMRIQGDREVKFEALRKLNLTEESMVKVLGSGLDVLTPRTDSDYRSWPEITEIFPLVFPGTKAGRTWVIGESKALLKARMDDLLEVPPGHRQVLFKDSPTGRKVADRLGRTNMPGSWDSASIRQMKEMPKFATYGYRSFDRQFIVADPRFLDRASAAWSVLGPRQLYMITLTSTKLGSGPVLTASPYVPDLDHFRGSYGAKNVMPLFRDKAGKVPNVPKGLLKVISASAKQDVTVEDLAAYVHGLLGTGAFSQRFAEELAEGAGPVRVPLTADPALFWRAVAIGRDLLWWHTWGERFVPDGSSPELPPGKTKELTPVSGYPDAFAYDPSSQTLTVGSGTFGPVSESVWMFDVSGLKALQSWLGYRMSVRKGKKSSPLDDVRPSRWTFSDELLRLISMLQHTVDMTPAASDLLKDIVAGPWIAFEDLPTPTDAERKVPKG